MCSTSWGESYLMVEPPGPGEVAPGTDNVVLRCHVEDVGAEKVRLERLGVSVGHATFEWGEILAFEDPAGNRIELKDAAAFEDQIRHER